MIEIGIPTRFKNLKELTTRKRNKIPAGLRFEILERDNSTCQIFGRKAPDVIIQIDHIIPLSKGGLTEKRNLRVLCEDCNLGKSGKIYFIDARHPWCRIRRKRSEKADSSRKADSIISMI